MVNPRYITEPHDCNMHAKIGHSWQVTDKTEGKVIRGLVYTCVECGRQWKVVTQINDLPDNDQWIDDRFLNSP